MTLHLTAESSFMGGDIKLKYSEPAFVFLKNVFGQTIQEVSLYDTSIACARQFHVTRSK